MFGNVLDRYMITSVNNAKIKHVAQLLQKSRVRREEKLFVIEGQRMFDETPNQLIEELYVTEQFVRGYADKERLTALNVETVTFEVFKKMSDTVSPQGVLAVVRMQSWEEDFDRNKKSFLLILEDVQDPGNLGTLVRTAEGAGADGIVMSRGTVDIYSPKVIRSTMGAIFRMPFIYVDDLPKCLSELKEKGIKVHAAALGYDTDYTKADYKADCAVMIGNEGNGLTKQAIDSAYDIVTIPMGGQLESLNAAVSGAILMYECNRQRRL